MVLDKLVNIFVDMEETRNKEDARLSCEQQDGHGSLCMGHGWVQIATDARRNRRM